MEATKTNFIVFNMTRPGLERNIYHTRGERANYIYIPQMGFLHEEQHTRQNL